MTIPQFLFDYSVFIIAAFYIIYIIIGLLRGFVLQVIDLFGMFIAIILAWLLSESFQSFYMFIPDDLINQSQYLSSMVQPILNKIVWFIIIFIVLTILVNLAKPLIEAITDLPVIRTVDRLLGAVVGVVSATVILIIISAVLSTPLFENGNEFVDNTELKYVRSYSDMAVEFVFNNYITDEAIEKLIEDSEIDFDINDILKDGDITSLIPTFATEEEDEKQKFEDFIEENNLPITAEELKFAVEYDFSDEQLQQLIDEYNVDLSVEEVREIINDLKE